MLRAGFAGWFWCLLLRVASSTFGVAEIPFLVESPVHHAVIANDELYVVTHPGPDNEIAKVTAAGSQAVFRLSPRFVANAQESDRFVVTREAWWYAALDGIGGIPGRPATTFFRADGTKKTHPSSLKQPVNSYLIALPGEEPHALEISVTADSTHIRELDWGGLLRSWQLPRIRPFWPHMTAESLSDGRIALFSGLEQLSLIILSDGGDVQATVLKEAPVPQFDTAIDDAGRVAIVAACSDTATIETAMIDVDRPSETEWRTIRRSVRVTRRLREIQVLAGPRGFVAAWVDETLGRRIEATELRMTGCGEAVVSVGRASPRGDAAFFDMQFQNDELVFWWDDGEHLYQRKLPLPLTSFALLEGLAQLSCSPGIGEASLVRR